MALAVRELTSSWTVGIEEHLNLMLELDLKQWQFKKLPTSTRHLARYLENPRFAEVLCDAAATSAHQLVEVCARKPVLLEGQKAVVTWVSPRLQ